MPFKNKKQMSWMYANKPSLAKKWTKKYGSHIKTTKSKRKTTSSKRSRR